MIAIIYNPNSTGDGEKLAKDLASELRTKLPRQKVQLMTTDHAGHGEEIAYDIASHSKGPLIISASGDGGYHDVVNGVMRALHKGFRPTTGLLPAGNANDHYRTVHTADIVEQIARGTTQKIDVLKLHGVSKGQSIDRYAHSYIGFGLTPTVGRALNKTKLTPITELFTVARSLFSARPVRLIVDGTANEYDSIVCSNIDQMSKYLNISTPSSTTDGMFEVTFFKRQHKLRLIARLLKSTLINAQEDRQTRTFSLVTTRSTLVQMDGEIVALDAHTKVDITIEHQALNCVV